jgi:hypothetical protein
MQKNDIAIANKCNVARKYSGKRFIFLWGYPLTLWMSALGEIDELSLLAEISLPDA